MSDQASLEENFDKIAFWAVEQAHDAYRRGVLKKSIPSYQDLTVKWDPVSRSLHAWSIEEDEDPDQYYFWSGVYPHKIHITHLRLHDFDAFWKSLKGEESEELAKLIEERILDDRDMLKNYEPLDVLEVEEEETYDE